MNQHLIVFTPLECERRTHVDTPCNAYHAGVKRHAKREVADLPSAWRELVMAWMSITGNVLVALIRGTKLHLARGKGPEWRRREGLRDRPGQFVRGLSGQIMREGRALTVTIKNAPNFSKAMSNAAAGEWSRRKAAVDPYCPLDQVAADMKADSQMDSGERSAELRNLSEAKKFTRGHTIMGKGRGVAPAKVTAMRTAIQVTRRRNDGAGETRGGEGTAHHVAYCRNVPVGHPQPLRTHQP